MSRRDLGGYSQRNCARVGLTAIWKRSRMPMTRRRRSKMRSVHRQPIATPADLHAWTGCDSGLQIRPCAARATPDGVPARRHSCWGRCWSCGSFERFLSSAELTPTFTVLRLSHGHDPVMNEACPECGGPETSLTWPGQARTGTQIEAERPVPSAILRCGELS